MSQGLTPIRHQYLKIKHEHPDAIVLFRLGDFYETFDEDARVASRELEIVLTSREMGKGHRVPLAGIPYHALDSYLSKLISRGYKVAICEQLTQAGEGRGLVERDVVRVVTPGTVVEPSLLDSRSNNYLASLALDGEKVGLAYVDITTSEFKTTQLSLKQAEAELERLKPSEVIVAESADLSHFRLEASISRLEDYCFDPDKARHTLLEHFGSGTLDGYGCSHLELATSAAGVIIHYLGETQKVVLAQLTHLSTYSADSYMTLDAETQDNLELFRSGRHASALGSLLSVIDLTRTPMGGRLLKRWLGQPLLDIAELKKRQDAVEWLCHNTLARKQLIALLGDVADLERLINRVRSGLVSPQELITLKRSLEAIPKLRAAFEGGSGDGPLNWLKNELKPRQDVVDLLSEALEDEPASSLGEGGVIRRGFSRELDNLLLAAQNARRYLSSLEQQERERTGIKSLKVGYNRVFGYYIEVSRSNLPQVPEDYIRKQTLVNGERFFTPELKEYESLILNARDKIAELETSLFKRVLAQVATASERVLEVAGAVAQLDVLSSLAEVAMRNRYVRPDLNEDSRIVIADGRHPMVERSLPEGSFVPNDTCLSNEDAQIVIMTGPNMSGKSTYLKQVALIVLLAQIGSFVPAGRATIGLVDRIFTRLGAREDLMAGQSTFMVEMVETANILNNATPRSLIILDEIGRGTSTYDGLSLAQAVVEYIHNYDGLGSKTLFATHYHEMVGLASFLPRVRNFNVAVTEEGGRVVFLRKVLPGGVDKSYGIHVAQLAGLPRPVVSRAEEILEGLEGGERAQVVKPAGRTSKQKSVAPEQLSFFGQRSAALEELKGLDVDASSPLEAITKLYELKKKASEEG